MKCRQPNVFSRSIIEETARLLAHDHPEVATRLLSVLSMQPVAKPALHTGDKNTDFFEIDLSKKEADDIIGSLLSAEAAAVSPIGETTPQASFIADLVDLWGRYADDSRNQN